VGEFWMAAAGPVASLSLSFVFVALASTVGGSAEAAPVAGVLAYLGTLNRVLGLFNLVPAFPLDGGRMLRAALWAWRKDLTWATRIAAGAGNAFGTTLIVFGGFRVLDGAVVEGLWLFLIGMFVRTASSGAYRQTLAQQIFAGQHIRQFMTQRPIVVAPELPLDELVENFVYRYHHKGFPVVKLGQPVGIVEVARVATLNRTLWHERKVADVMTALNPDMVISPDAEVLVAIAQMQRTHTSRLLVVSRGQLVGILALRDLLELLALKLQLEGHYLGHGSGSSKGSSNART
jgi:CBS domain-containing protein